MAAAVGIFLTTFGTFRAQDAHDASPLACALGTKRMLSMDAIFTGGEVPGGVKVLRGSKTVSEEALRKVVARVTKVPIGDVKAVTYGGALFLDIEQATCNKRTADNETGYVLATSYIDGYLWVTVCDVSSGKITSGRSGKLSSPGKILITNVLINNARYVLVYQWVDAISTTTELKSAQKWAIDIQNNIHAEFQPKIPKDFDLNVSNCDGHACMPAKARKGKSRMAWSDSGDRQAPSN